MKTLLLSFVLSASALASVDYYDFWTAPVQKFISKAPAEVLAPVKSTENFSGLTYNTHSRTFYGIVNKGNAIFEFDANFKQARTINISGFSDPEDIAFVGQTAQGPLIAISDETGAVYVGLLKSNTLKASDMNKITLLDQSGRTISFNDNKGLEGITYLPKEDYFIVIKEKKPMAVWGFKINWQNPVLTLPVKNVFPAATESTIASLVTDLSAVSYNAKEDAIVLLSHESSKLVYVDNKTKQVTKTVDIAVKEQHEGLAFSADFETAFVAAEPYYLFRVNKLNTTQVSR